MQEDRKRFKTFLEWCGRQEWDLFLALGSPDGATAASTDTAFQSWITKIEQADGTLAFRWVRFTQPRARRGNALSYVLVGGLSTGECLRWMRLWTEINGGGELEQDLVYRRRTPCPKVGRDLRAQLGGEIFDIEMRVGPKTIRRARSLSTRVD